MNYKVIKLYKINPFKKINIVGSLKMAMKDLTPLSYYLYNLLLFADSKDFSPSYKVIASLLEISLEVAKTLVEELREKGYVVIRKVGKQTHFIIYYDSLDSLINGEYKKKDIFERATLQKNYNKAYKNALRSLERKKKKLEQERGKG